MSACFLMVILFFFTSYQADKFTKEGIIIVSNAQVRYSPSYLGAVAFELSEGTKAQILRKEGDWSQIRLTRKNSGWVETAAIEEI